MAGTQVVVITARGRATFSEAQASRLAEGRMLQTGHTAWYSAEVIGRGYEMWIANLCELAAGEPRRLVDTL
ncbi:hypothetical protein [Cohnella nanjingensis]|uniref:Uncharacterized protein n=1 Tax=Cohnella nanjingensis TaxID=1387779 RepID=A0A7X0VHT5_9BACL|nr:hypothetical protein [Cohnella nanjingensis]MBB6674482.1 hypothetical protein [Cohnella nanjingensis]